MWNQTLNNAWAVNRAGLAIIAGFVPAASPIFA
jgi:hypothetical protein